MFNDHLKSHVKRAASSKSHLWPSVNDEVKMKAEKQNGAQALPVARLPLLPPEVLSQDL